MALTSQQIQEYRNKYSINPVNNTNPSQDTESTVKNLGIGFAKGVGDSLKGIQNLGDTVAKKILPGYEALPSTETGIQKLKNTNFDSSNTTQKVGKGAEILTELLFPTGLAQKGTRATGAVFDKVGTGISTIADDALENGVKIKDKIGDMLVNLDQKTKTALERTPKEVFQNFVELGKKAVADDRVRTPLETVGDNIIGGLDKVKKITQNIGAQKSQLIKLPEAFEGTGIKDFGGKLNSFLNSRTLRENDKPIIKSVVEEFKKLGKTPSKGQVDKFIDYAQDVLYAGEKNLVQPTSGQTTARLRTLLSGLNNSLKDQLPSEYRKLNDQYAKLTRFSSEINSKLGKEGGNAGSFVKRLFSPSDARTKELFEQLQKFTGEDYSRDARLAKFIMESLGDTRAASILEQIPTSPKGVIMKGLDYAANKLSDPIKAGERYISKTKK